MKRHGFCWILLLYTGEYLEIHLMQLNVFDEHYTILQGMKDPILFKGCCYYKHFCVYA